MFFCTVHYDDRGGGGEGAMCEPGTKISRIPARGKKCVCKGWEYGGGLLLLLLLMLMII